MNIMGAQSALSYLLSPLLRRPLLLLALCWGGGIVLASAFPLPWSSWVWAALLLLLAWAITQQMPSLIAAPALWGAVLCLAAGVSTWQMMPPATDAASYLPPGGMVIRGYPLAPPSTTLAGWHVLFHVVSRRQDTTWRTCCCDLYLSGRTLPAPLLGHLHQVLGHSLRAEEPGNPYGLSWPAYLRAHDLSYAVMAYLVTPLPIRSPWSPWLTLRAYLEQRLAASMTGDYGTITAQFICSTLFGVHGEALPAQLTAKFRRAGTIHLLVASGSQLALLGGILLLPLGFIQQGRNRTSYPRLRMALLLVSVPLLIAFVMLADRGPSLDRAVLMCLLAMLSLFLAFSPLARARSFRVDRLTLFAASALILLICRPDMLMNPAMQLSLVAIIGLITIAPLLLRLLRPLLGAFAIFPAMSLSAQFMTAPVLAWQFGAISLIGPITNLLAVPLMVVLMPLGALSLLCAAILPPLAKLMSLLTVPLVEFLIMSNVAAGNISWAETLWPVHSLWAVLCYYGGLAGTLALLSCWISRREQHWRIPAGREPRMW